MKISAAGLICLACSLATSSSLAQGQINWANTSSTLISLNALPMPVRVSPESTYYFGLFIAPLGTPAPAQGIAGAGDPNWQFVAAYAMNSTAASGAGRMQNPGVATVNGFDPGTTVNFIVRSWQSSTGGADWAAARPGLVAYGHSALGTAVLGGGAIIGPMAFGTNSGQISGFSVICMSCTPIFVTVPSNAVVSLGGSVTFGAFAVNGWPPYLPVSSYQWRKEGSSISGATNPWFTLNHVTLSDAGKYDVLAFTVYGGSVSPQATLTVVIPAVVASLARIFHSAI